jgi:hypothetical protein
MARSSAPKIHILDIVGRAPRAAIACAQLVCDDERQPVHTEVIERHHTPTPTWLSRLLLTNR